MWVDVLQKVGFFAEQAEVSEKCCRTCGGFWKVLQERSLLALFKVWIHFSIVSSFLSFSGCRGGDAHTSPFLWHVLMKPFLPVFWDYRGGFNPCCLHPGLWAELVDSLPSTPQSCEHSDDLSFLSVSLKDFSSLSVLRFLLSIHLLELSPTMPGNDQGKEWKVSAQQNSLKWLPLTVWPWASTLFICKMWH